MKTSLRAPTRYEAERIAAMMKLGCVACAALGIPYVLVECHHLLDGNVRMGHWFSIPLCAGHHRGEFTKLQKELIPARKRVAISSGRKAFARVYGTERQLWTRVQERLRLPAVWPSSKILPRRGYAELASDTVELLAGAAAPAQILPRGAAPGGRDSEEAQ